ncbi:MAG TPA: flagellar hook capping FlgD N-terminal domain-containing protein [Verrucomicrobiae bacterium]|jgi:flagellar basal-body rod modification protein FlgD|nr:flagellar hook capping FlgD N-terminal domain-containing protein [Verrucomicrobiae bacterium]
MQVNATANVGTGTTSSDTVSGSQQTLNQKDFLQLLVAQMQNQDPLNPQSDTDMAAQMAQFTSLTQSSAMSSSLSMLQANSLIGSTVSLQIDPKTTASGVVQGVILNGGTPQIIVNGSTYDLSQVTSVTPTVAAPTASPAPTTN